jgi:hypothetical protein
MNTTKRYFKWIQKESSICKAFQKYIENKRDCKSFLKTRDDKQAPIDFMWRFYDKVTWETIVEVAVEVRSLELSIEYIEKWLWFIMFPISKLNELMKFRRMKKEVYIVYLLKDKVYFLLWDYYLTHNFELWFYKKWPFIKLPIRNLIECWEM